MILIDVHTHLDYFSNDEIENIIERCRKNNVVLALTQGLNPKSNRKSLEISKKYDLVKLAMGIYPDDILDYSDEEIEDELKFIEKNKENIIAIGEVGLDYKGEKTDNDKEKQKKYFGKFISLAKKLKIPIIVHSRKAEVDSIDLLEKSGYNKIIMHCFSGNHKLVERIRKNNWFFTIPTNIVRSEHFQKVVRETPIKQLFTETDAPFLSPYREKKNEPSFVIETIKMIAKIKGLDDEEVGNMIYKNYQNLF